jgi:hypothetical protein
MRELLKFLSLLRFLFFPTSAAKSIHSLASLHSLLVIGKGLVMASPENFGTNNGMPSVGGDLVPSLLDSATLSPALDAPLLGLSLSPKNPVGSSSINSRLEQLGNKLQTTTNSQMLADNPNTATGGSDSSLLFGSLLGRTPQTYYPTGSTNSQNQDPLTGSKRVQTGEAVICRHATAVIFIEQRL